MEGDTSCETTLLGNSKEDSSLALENKGVSFGKMPLGLLTVPLLVEMDALVAVDVDLDGLRKGGGLVIGIFFGLDVMGMGLVSVLGTTVAIVVLGMDVFFGGCIFIVFVVEVEVTDGVAVLEMVVLGLLVIIWEDLMSVDGAAVVVAVVEAVIAVVGRGRGMAGAGAGAEGIVVWLGKVWLGKVWKTGRNLEAADAAEEWVEVVVADEYFEGEEEGTTLLVFKAVGLRFCLVM